MKTLPAQGRWAMPERRRYKAGDVFTSPMSFQLLKVFGHEDRVFYLCAPVDDVKRVVCINDPHFLMCMESPVDGDPVIPPEVLERACNFVEIQYGKDEADE
jgi:hypothetical protein